MNNCENPLKLIYHLDGYKVNKPDDQSGLYVDKQVADELLAACEWAVEQIKRLGNEGRYPQFMLRENGGDGMMPLIRAIKIAKQNTTTKTK